MKILSSAQIYKADQATIKSLGISSTELMEIAATKCADWIKGRYSDRSRQIHVFCGMGNNGGDGLVISRILIEAGYSVTCYNVNFSEKKSEDFLINFKQLKQAGCTPLEIFELNNFPHISSKELVIDAIFGLGLTREPKGIAKEVIKEINRSKAEVVAIDFPSGLFAEGAVTEPSSVIKADYTLTFQNPKLAFFLPDNRFYIKNWIVLDIGLDQNYIDSVDCHFKAVEEAMIKAMFKTRKRFTHKGSFGHSLMIGGSFGKIGAVILASRASLKTGSGLVSSYIPKCGYTAMQSSNPEIMVEVDDENYLQFFNFKTKPTTIGIGMGMGMHLKTKKGFIAFLKSNKIPMLIDADGLNIIAEHEELSDLILENTILTPHPKEFERLVGSWENDYEKLDKQNKFSNTHKCLVILKGAYTSISYEDEIYFNTSGNPGLATAGSGDVLSGIITGLLAQGYKPLEAALIGVYVHGRAADLGIQNEESMESFIASNCINNLGKVFKELV